MYLIAYHKWFIDKCSRSNEVENHLNNVEQTLISLGILENKVKDLEGSQDILSVKHKLQSKK